MKYLLTAALVVLPTLAMAEPPENSPIEQIRSEIRDDNRQLQEDRDAGYTEAARDDERQLAEDKMRLREAQRHPNRETPPPPHKGKPQLRDGKPVDESGEQVNAKPPEQPEHDEWQNGSNTSAKLNPDRPFNHSAHVDNEIR